MQKIKLGELHYGIHEVLTKQQMKKIMGGVVETPQCFADTCQGGATGSSCWHSTGWDFYDCSLNQAQAMEKANSEGGLWCTESCCESCSPSRPEPE